MKRNLPKVLALAALAWGVTTSAEGATPHETICSTPAPLPSGTCEVSGSGSDTLLVGTVLAPDHIYRGGQVLIDSGGDILCVGDDQDALGKDPTPRFLSSILGHVAPVPTAL